ncbi:ABC transporter ATP-binding protein [Paenibacillus sp. N1-5-1-14]|uniref:ABC transporter ATP-binding protein n=1 Tax=Paenibacillus radicibacter TaxID=2972488 RepID=UPI0021595197|nr:ABC transporter ATP-binding protein [Paenibacillus radicibacter]MCR8645936.1 ABC transporter ATP-binding protein [Paenibacillus radicibacter]
MIKIIGITKKYDGVAILDNCNFEANNKVYGLLGRNGAGKTTLFKVLLGLIQADEGTATISGYDSQKQTENLLKYVGATIETPKIYLHLTAFDNLSIHLSYMDIEEKLHDQLISEVLAMVGLINHKDKKVSKFSLGMKQRLAIARAIVHKPKVLILDEPLNGLDPISIKEMRGLFKKLSAEQSMTILFSSHILQEVLAVSDHLLVLQNGSLVVNTSIGELKEKYEDHIEDYLIHMMEDKIYA